MKATNLFGKELNNSGRKRILGYLRDALLFGLVILVIDILICLFNKDFIDIIYINSNNYINIIFKFVLEFFILVGVFFCINFLWCEYLYKKYKK